MQASKLVSFCIAMSCATPSLVMASDNLKADASEVLKADRLGPAAGTRRVAITSCNVLFGVLTTANAATQRGFGDTSQRVEAKVNVTYELRGLTQDHMQQLTEQLCKDAAESFKAAGFEVVPPEQVAAVPEFAKLHATGYPTPYPYNRAGSEYLTFAPTGQRVIDTVYLKQTDNLFSNLKAMNTDGPMFIEARLAKALAASAVHVNYMVDFASASANTPSGFLGRLVGSEQAKVESKVEMSLSGFVTLVPESRIDCSSGFCQGANDARLVARITSKAPLLGSNAMVREIIDTKTKGDKLDEAAANVIGGLAALVGSSGSSYNVTKNGVVVDPAAYGENARVLVKRFTSMGAAMLMQ